MKQINFPAIIKSLEEVILHRISVMRLLILFTVFSSSVFSQTTLKSTYDYLQSDGHFNTYLNLIDDLNYKDILSQAGSDKTLFVSDDAAFAEFFKNNAWHVSGYSQLSNAQKKLLLNYSIINNAYPLSSLGDNYWNGMLNPGVGFRKNTMLSVLDSVPFLSGDQLPANSYWNYYRIKGIHLVCDNTISPLVFFTQQNIDQHSFTNEDLDIMCGIKSRQYNDVHVFNIKVDQKDIPCSNGYINVLHSVLVPQKNMAQFLFDNKDGDPSQSTKIFSELMARFSAPYYDGSFTGIYKQLYPESSDSIFVKKYFAYYGGKTVIPNYQIVNNLLEFDPGWNHFDLLTRAFETDMGAIFAPSDQAMTDFLNRGIGYVLKKRFDNWENIPDAIVLPLIKRHMRLSLNESVPGRFGKMIDADNYRLPVEKSQITKTYLGCNGVVYVTNQVYPSQDFQSLYSPVLLGSNTKIMNWVIKCNNRTTKDGTPFSFYKLYLNALKNKTNLYIPADESFNRYIDPIAYGQDVPGVIKFRYNEQSSSVYATLYRYNKTTDVVGDSVGVITDQAFILNRLYHMLDQHIVSGSIDSGNGYYISRSNDIIKVSGSGSSLTVQGGRDLENNTKAEVSDGQVFNQENGTACFLTKPVDPTLKSVYKVLSTTPQFSKFFELLKGVPDTCVSQIFTQQGIDYRVRFFNAFNYTVYVPTNEAIQAAIDNGTITPWSQIYGLVPGQVQSAAINKMLRFLRYHFQDNAVFYGQNLTKQFRTQTIKQNDALSYWNTAKNKFLKIGVTGTDNTLKLTTENGKTANVVTQDGLYNIIAKDYVFAQLPSKYKNIDGTGSATGSNFVTSTITSSSSAVIHQIDNVLTFE
ncbi:fasciclin domain-containing protein [Parabacteroides sp. FAFU027]|uniref:fasciclin domain-containing protein n=1 Tax=Parabacteroides sp. FAFU027 TaxID=2922715 RepID=UPI001FB0458C|nr:fasciclin domain-containing protein [Parabacteroides sp. FAFU027]